jgi:hypothetical protein
MFMRRRKTPIEMALIGKAAQRVDLFERALIFAQMPASLRL